MAYVAVRGGKEAIESSIERLKYNRLKGESLLETKAVLSGMRSLVYQVMSEASLYSPDLAALAIKQGEGSPEEAVFILRAYRSTVPRIHNSHLLTTENLIVERRISAAFKDIPGGQILGASTDYTQRLMNFDLLHETLPGIQEWLQNYEKGKGDFKPLPRKIPKVVDYLRKEGLLKEIPENEEEPKDVTMASLSFPTKRGERLQVLTRGQTGAVTALGYGSLRGFGGGALHPTVGELRVGRLGVTIPDPYDHSDEEEDGYYIGEVQITEVETLIPVHVKKGQGETEVEFELGYGICYGQNETKAVAMSLLDHNLEVGDQRYPTHQEEFVLLHIDSVEATGFISHLKLPHYVTFQAKLDSVRKVKQSKKERAHQ